MYENVIAMVNNKGGVGKTSIACNIAGIAARSSWKTLLIELDKQGDAATELGYEDDPVYTDDLGQSICDALLDITDQLKPILIDQRPNLDVIPAGPRMESLDIALGSKGIDQGALARKLEPIQQDYDLIIIDCSPHGGPLVNQAFGAARGIVCPTQLDRASYKGISRLGGNFQTARAGGNEHIALLGIALFGIDSKATKFSAIQKADLAKSIGDVAPIFESTIRSSKVAAGHMRSSGLLAYEYEESKSHANAAESLAGDYTKLAEEILHRLDEVNYPLLINNKEK